jgi:hypothetical protein
VHRLTKTIAFTLTVIQLLGCGLFDSESDNVVDNYEVIWIDVVESRRLIKNEQLVPAYVFGVGHDSKYIYAEQHPLAPNSPDKIDKNITNYYIIERNNDEFQDKPTLGPLTKRSFDSLCRQLHIDDPKFDMTYPTNLY